jgi:hypothetical protein
MYECVITGSQDTIGYAGNSCLGFIICWLFGWQLHLYVNICDCHNESNMQYGMLQY